MIDDGDVVVGIIDLQIRILVQIIEDLFTVRILLAFDDDGKTVPSRFIPDIDDAFDLL